MFKNIIQLIFLFKEIIMDIDLSDVKSIDTVPLTARDRQFFTELNRSMDNESAKVGDNPSKERFAIFRLAFEKVNSAKKRRRI